MASPLPSEPRPERSDSRCESPSPTTGIGASWWILVLLAYAVLVTAVSFRVREQINRDGIAYIRLAEHLVKGEFDLSVSSHWSPLITWCLAPLVAAGVDGLYAGRIVVAVWGGVFLIVAGLLMSRVGALSGPWGRGAFALLALWMVNWVARVIAPDVMLGACIALYLLAVTHPRLLQRSRRQFLCGLCAGLAYLAKAYAFPFFVVHYPVMLALAGLREGPGSPSGIAAPPAPSRLVRVGRAWVLGMLGFALVGGPWMGVLSWKSGHFTFSTAGRYNRSIVGPPGVAQEQPDWRGLWSPRPGQISVWETPETLPVAEWSPLQSRAYLKHEIVHAAKNGRLIRKMISEFDFAGLALCAILASPLAFLVLRQRRQDAFGAFWIPATCLIYCSGYAFVLVENRYLEPVLWPLCWFWCVHLVRCLWDRVAPDAGAPCARGVRTTARLPVAFLVAVFGVFPAAELTAAVAQGRTDTYRRMAYQLRKAGETGPIAATRRVDGLFIAYHMREPFLGSPEADTWGPCEAELRDKDVRLFLVWPESPLAKADLGRSAFAPVDALDPLKGSQGERVRVFRLAAPVATSR